MTIFDGRLFTGLGMRFIQLDRITEIVPGESITARRCLALSEDYLEDHFPRFPVMPGVLMLESLYQSSMWLIRATDKFEYSTVVVREAKNIRFKGFMQPGDTLMAVCEIKSRNGNMTKLAVKGTIDGEIAVSGRLELESYNLADRDMADTYTDNYLKKKFSLTYRRLCNQLDKNNPMRLLPTPQNTT